MNKLCDTCLHRPVCGKWGKGDPAMVFCDDRFLPKGLIPTEWVKEWALKSENTYNRDQIVEMLNDWGEENEVD